MRRKRMRSGRLRSLRNDRESTFAFLNLEDGVSRIPLREDCLFFGQGYNFPALADSGKEFPWVEVVLFLGWTSW